MTYDEIYRCADCGYEPTHAHQLKWEDPEHCRCPNCASPVIDDVAVAWATGDGSMAKLMANGQCPKCQCEMGGEMKCENCGLEIIQA